MVFHQKAADELGGNLLGGTGEEGLGEVLGGLGDYRYKVRYFIMPNIRLDLHSTLELQQFIN